MSQEMEQGAHDQLSPLQLPSMPQAGQQNQLSETVNALAADPNFATALLAVISNLMGGGGSGGGNTNPNNGGNNGNGNSNSNGNVTTSNNSSNGNNKLNSSGFQVN